MTTNPWPYPGSRWWKFDFHAHTPSSFRDTPVWQKAIATADEVTPEKWLLKYMAAEIDCVAVTDHNSGAWIDELQNAYTQMKEQSPDGFRELTIFPGVEISAQGGVHVLAIFDPDKKTADIDSLLGSVSYRGTKGDSDAVTEKGITEVLQAILDAGAIAIPAHADKKDEKGLLGLSEASTLRQAVEMEGLLAVEWRNLTVEWPSHVSEQASRLTKVLGSDCHSFQGEGIPGSRYTWVKMARPSLEGLRLALLDGNEVSIWRSDEGKFDPFKVPAHVITAIEIENARYMGNGQPARLECSPFFNAIVGGRGTGKSTVVHALRLAARRGQELDRLEGEPLERFRAFNKVAQGRDGKGALKDNTKIRLEWRHEEERLRLCWRPDGSEVVASRRDGQWQESDNQSVNADRFPVRIFSQGQIAAMAGGGRQILLSIIDETANVEPLWQAFKEAKNTFFVQRARLRELENKLAGQTEIKRKLQETEKNWPRCRKLIMRRCCAPTHRLRARPRK